MGEKINIDAFFGATFLNHLRLAVGKRKFMRLFLVTLCIALGFSSCDIIDEEENQTVTYRLPVQYVVAAEENISLGDTIAFQLSYSRPSDCYIFNGFDVVGSGFDRFISVQAIVFNLDECSGDQGNIFEVPYEFIPSSPGTYEFRFWSGSTALNESEYIAKTIIVENTN